MGVQVDHPGQHDPRTQVEAAAASAGPPARAGIGEAPGRVDKQQAVGLVSGPTGRQRRQQAGAQRERGSIRES